jgi:hypothetical protein
MHSSPFPISSHSPLLSALHHARNFALIPLQWGTVRVDTTDGSGALCFDPTVHNVVVVFGGPGCSKGRVTSLLTKEYGFDLISMETVVRFLL